MAPSDLLSDLLRDVSRSFYLTLRVLPGSIRPQIGLAYLLARMTDTIADTTLVPLDRRLTALRLLRARILGQSAECMDFSEFTHLEALPNGPDAGAGFAAQSEAASAAERRLLTRVEDALGCLERLPVFDREQLRTVLRTIISGQELDLVRFAESSPNQIVALATDEELDDYTYRVAGCVGEFWTRMCRAHVFPEAALDDEFLLHAGVRFGKGLQLVNVLRDLPHDVRQGRCYLPGDSLEEAGLKPSDLLGLCRPNLSPGAESAQAGFPPRRRDERLPQSSDMPASERHTWPNASTRSARPPLPGTIAQQLEACIERYRQVATAHLAAGWAYTLALPKQAARVRLACAWPILIGIKTLQKQRKAESPASGVTVKISRAEVYRLLARTTLLYPTPHKWGRLFADVASASSFR